MPPRLAAIQPLTGRALPRGLETPRLRIRLAAGPLDRRVGHRLIQESQLAAPMGLPRKLSWQVFERPFRNPFPPDLYLIENRADRRLIGVVILWRPSVQEWPLIHYGLTPSYRGRGLATEAVRAIVASVLGRGQAPGIAAIVANSNVGSVRVVRSVGMSPLKPCGESTLFGIGREDVMVLGLLRQTIKAAGVGGYRMAFTQMMAYAWAVPYLRRTVLWLAHLLPSA
jgi:RimJ/RimL family protein N-acetyltransferase